MVNFQTFAIFLILCHALSAQCGKGTLQCDFSDPLKTSPKICDFINFYFFNPETGTCQKKSIPGCELPSFGSTETPCFRCQPGYALDATQLNCVPIPDSKRILNCFRYSLKGDACLECESGFWKFGAGCKEFKGAPIEGCAVYASDSQCRSCAQGFFLKDNRCVAFDVLEGCALHTDRVCDQCAPEFILDASLGLLTDRDAPLTESLYQTRSQHGMWSVGSNVSSPCALGSIRNCQEYESAHKCRVCKANYFLTPGFQCQHFPETPIANCKEYTNATVCSRCEFGFFRVDFQTCRPATPVEHCTQTALEEDRCTKCGSSHVLSPDGRVCSSRNNFPIQQCIGYATLSDNCEICDGNYSLTLDALGCLENVENCQNQVNQASLGSGPHTCSMCKEGFYLERPTKCVSVTVEKCIRYRPNTNQCVECEHMFFVTGADGQECQLRSVDRCAEYVSNTNQCQSCLEGFYLESPTRCSRLDVDNCLEFLSDQNLCAQCVDGYYPANGGTQCLAKSIQNCLEYDPNGSNKCSLCSSLMRPSDDGTACQSISHSERCFQSNGTQDTCSECLPLYFLENGLCTGSLDPTQVDSNCLSNSNSSASFSCTKCRDQHALVKSTSLAVDFDFFDDHHCLRIDSSSGDCTQCADLHEFQDAACVPAPDASSLSCKRIEPGKNNSLSSNQHCEECVDYLTHYLLNGECLPRTNPTIGAHCGLTDPSTDSNCLSCGDGQLNLIPLQSSAPIGPKCTHTGSLSVTWSAISDCVIYTPQNTCHQCTSQMAVSADGLSCEDQTSPLSFGVSVYLDRSLNPSSAFSGSIYSEDNCESYDQLSPSQFGCSSCEYEYRRVVPQPDPLNPQAYQFGSAADYNGFHVDRYNKFECLDQTMAFLLDDFEDHVDPDNCAVGYSVEDHSGYICLSCSYPYRGEIVSVAYDSDGVELDTPITAVGNCTDENYDFDSLYKLLDHEIRDAPHRLLWSNYMQFDSCTDSSQDLVYMYITSIKDPFIRLASVAETGDSPLKQAYCLSSSQISSPVEHCAIYVLSQDLDENFDPSLDTLTHAKCVACAPSYKSALDANGEFITSCSPIPNCSMSEASWLGACSTPTNSAWELERVTMLGAEIELVAYHKPVAAADTLANCLVVDRTALGPICRLCDSTFTVQDGACVSISDLDGNCTESVLGFTSLTVGSHLESFQFTNFAYLRLNEYNLDNENFVTVLCGTCQADHVMVNSNQVSLGGWIGLAHQKQCKVPSPGEFTPTYDPNCSLSDMMLPQKCHKCKPGYLLDETLRECHLASEHPNCLSLQTVDGVLRCIKCEQKYMLNSLHLCALHNCKEWDFYAPNQCAVCDAGFGPAPDSSSFCVPVNQSSDQCELYSASLGYCVQCKAVGHIPYIFIQVALPPQTLRTECMPFSFDGPWLSQYRLSYPYVMVNVLLDLSIHSVSLESVITLDQARRTLSMTPESFPEAHCMPTPPVAHCHPLHFSEFLVCRQCSAGYLLSKFNTCDAGSVPDCLQYSSDGSSCTTCTDTHYLANDGSECSPRVHSITCLDRHATLDQCLSCDGPDQWLHPVFKECRPSTSANCLEYEPNSDQCATCLELYWKRIDSDSGLASCEPFTARHCATRKSDKNECDTCLPGMLKDTSSGTVVCKQYSATNCSEFHPSRDECASCADEYWKQTQNGLTRCIQSNVENCSKHQSDLNECRMCNPGFYLEQSKCLPLTPVDHCVQFSSDSDACVICQNGFYLRRDLNECLPFPNGIPYCTEYASTNQCLRCQELYFLRDNICTRVHTIVPFCDIHDSPSTCGKCVSGFYFDTSSSSCQPVSVQHCLEASSVDTCTQCEAAYYPDPSGQCQPSPVAHCTRVDLSNPSQCLECLANHALSEDSKSCVVVSASVIHCSQYNSDQTCRHCDSGFILSVDGRSCELLTDQAGSNCSRAFMVERATCDVCRLGFAKDSQGSCQPSKISKCWVPDSSGHSCLLCESGSYMDDQGKCIFDFVSCVDRLKTLLLVFGVFLMNVLL